MRRSVLTACLSLCAGNVLHGQEASKGMLSEWADVVALRELIESNYLPISTERERIEARVSKAETAYKACNALLGSDEPKALVEQSQISWRALQRDRKWINNQRDELEKRNRTLEIERDSIESRKGAHRVDWYEQQMLNLIARIREEYLVPFETDIMVPTISYLNGASQYARFIEVAAKECDRNAAQSNPTPKLAGQPAERVLAVMYRNFVDRVTALQNLLIPQKR